VEADRLKRKLAEAFDTFRECEKMLKSNKLNNVDPECRQQFINIFIVIFGGEHIPKALAVQYNRAVANAAAVVAKGRAAVKRAGDQKKAEAQVVIDEHLSEVAGWQETLDQAKSKQMAKQLRSA
jgi:type III secretion system FlhB-like substrate exporter